jgi:outer membrane receptor protein involved in Fe transport
MAAPGLGSPTGYLHIASNITWDLSLGYDTKDSFADVPLSQNVHLQLTGTDILDKKPPFFLNAASNPAILFDPNQASALGRTITVKLSKDF